ncbi:MAG: membrane protein insertase YidC, partial [candidate division Zixibacteria bacterium]|nr:membrane protein insertase YidC [candidate division Zixibacteria bacterium]
IILSNYGGGPVSLKLHEYKYHTGERIEMLPECRQATPELIFLGGTLNANNLVYNSSLTKGKYSATTSPLELTYTYRNEKGAALSKRYRFYPDRYDYDLIVDIDNRGSLGFEREYSLEWNNRLDPTERDIASDYNAMWAMAYQGKERIKFTDYTNNKYDVALSGNTDWIAMRSKYFAAALIPRSKPAVAAKSSGVKENVAMAGGTILTQKVTIGLTIELPNTDKVTDSFTVLAGPIDYENLKSYNNTMADLVDIEDREVHVGDAGNSAENGGVEEKTQE